MTTTLVSTSPYQLDTKQVTRASKALISKLQKDETEIAANGSKADLLADADLEDASDLKPVWLIVTTKKHISDKRKLKPRKIVLPHPYTSDAQKVCLITADPQRRYKELLEHPSIPVEISKSVTKVIGLEKIKSRYKSYESKRQLAAEYDVFLADDRIATYLPSLLGKVFYKTTAKRPIPVSLEGRRQNVDAQGVKRKKLSEGGTKVVKSELKPVDMAHEISRALKSTLVHLAPSTTTAVKVGNASMTADQVQENIATVVEDLVGTALPGGWRNVRSMHIKGPSTIALPIWMTDELWADAKDIREP